MLLLVILVEGSYMTSPVDELEMCWAKEEADPALCLTKELLHIQMEMKRFQQDRQQLWYDPAGLRTSW